MADVKGFGKVVGNGEVKEVKLSLAECMTIIEELECCLMIVTDKLSGKSKKFKMTRKEMVIEVIKSGAEIGVKEIAAAVSILAGVEITSKNISSQLSYLRDDFDKGVCNYEICRVGRGHGKIKAVKREDR